MGYVIESEKLNMENSGSQSLPFAGTKHRFLCYKTLQVRF